MWPIPVVAGGWRWRRRASPSPRAPTTASRRCGEVADGAHASRSRRPRSSRCRLSRSRGTPASRGLRAADPGRDACLRSRRCRTWAVPFRSETQRDRFVRPRNSWITVATPGFSPGFCGVPRRAAAPFLSTVADTARSCHSSKVSKRVYGSCRLDKDVGGMEVLWRNFVVNKHKFFVAYQLPGQRSETVRRSNLSSILRELHNRGPRFAVGAGGEDRTDPQRDPRAHRRAGPLGPRLRAARRPGRALRAARRRSSGPAPAAPSSWRSRSPSTRWPSPRSGSAGRSSTSSAWTAPATAPRSTRPSPTSPPSRAPCSAGCPTPRA